MVCMVCSWIRIELGFGLAGPVQRGVEVEVKSPIRLRYIKFTTTFLRPFLSFLSSIVLIFPGVPSPTPHLTSHAHRTARYTVSI